MLLDLDANFIFGLNCDTDLPRSAVGISIGVDTGRFKIDYIRNIGFCCCGSWI